MKRISRILETWGHLQLTVGEMRRNRDKFLRKAEKGELEGERAANNRERAVRFVKGGRRCEKDGKRAVE